jgi:hypothetical protein
MNVQRLAQRADSLADYLARSVLRHIEPGLHVIVHNPAVRWSKEREIRPQAGPTFGAGSI